MTTPSQSATQPPQPDSFGPRTIVAAGGALAMVVLALIVYAVTGMWLPTLIIVLLIPIHVALTITDTNLLEDPKTAPSRAWSELQKLTGWGTNQGGATQSGAWRSPAASAPWAGPAGPTQPADVAQPGHPGPPHAGPAHPGPPHVGPAATSAPPGLSLIHI